MNFINVHFVLLIVVYVFFRGFTFDVDDYLCSFNYMLIKYSCVFVFGCVCGQRGVCFTILLIRNDDQFDYINKCYLCVGLPGIKIRTNCARYIYLCVYSMSL